MAISSNMASMRSSQKEAMKPILKVRESYSAMSFTDAAEGIQPPASIRHRSGTLSGGSQPSANAPSGNADVPLSRDLRYPSCASAPGELLLETLYRPPQPLPGIHRHLLDTQRGLDLGVGGDIILRELAQAFGGQRQIPSSFAGAKTLFLQHQFIPHPKVHPPHRH